MKLFSKKLPTIIALLLLTIGLAVAYYLVKNPQLFTPKAGPETLVPNNIKVSNLGLDSFTVSFTTQTDTISYLLVGTEPSLSIETSNQFIDSRNQISGSLNPFQTHYIAVANGRSYQNAKFTLESGKTYYYKIGLGGLTGIRQLFDDHGQPYKIDTAGEPNNSPADIISGTVFVNNAKVEDALVYLSIPNATLLSDQTKQGRFVIPANTAYTSDLSKPASYDPQSTVIDLFIQGPQLTSTVKSLTSIKNLPDIILGQNYDLTSEEPSPPTPTESLASNTDKPIPTLTESRICQDNGGTWKKFANSCVDICRAPKTCLNAETWGCDCGAQCWDAAVKSCKQDDAAPTPTIVSTPMPTPTAARLTTSGFNVTIHSTDGQTVPSVTNAPQAVSITNPTRENEVLSSRKPEFRGTGPAGKLLTLTIESSLPLTASVTVGANGIWKYTPADNLAAGTHTITVSYLDPGQNEKTARRQFSIAAAGSTSATLPSFTATGSGQISPTKAPTKTPTLTPTPASRKTMPSTDSGVPKSGLVNPTIYITLIGLLFLLLAARFSKN